MHSRYSPTPWQLMMQQMQKEMEHYQRQGGEDPAEDTTVATSAWTPAVDILEMENVFILRADIPGVDPKTIDIGMENGILDLKGERAEVEEDAAYKRSERAKGGFHRRFTLPDNVDEERISASGNNGVLEIVLPKRLAKRSRKIQVD